MNNHEKETEILFYKIKSETSDLLSKLLYQYSTQKEGLIQKHQVVIQYINLQKSEPLNIKLEDIYQKINDGEKESPYNIYITDKNLVIRNTTFKSDIGFDLSFAKRSFDEHYARNITGICTPLFEKSSKRFMSYTDSYLLNDAHEKIGVLQISYTYNDSRNKLLKIQQIIGQYPNLKEAKAYIIVDTGIMTDIILKDYPSYKPDLKEILARIDEGTKVNNKLHNTSLTINSFTKDSKPYKALYLSSTSPILDNTNIVYSILLDESVLESKIRNLNIVMFLITLLGTVAIIISARIRGKEIKLTEQDRFVQSSMHEIKTPLSVITLNNELRELEFGKDEYSQEIDSAIKILKTSYDDMSFSMTGDQLKYPVETISLSKVVLERAEYFKTIAKSNTKAIAITVNSDIIVQMSLVELIRLIDNNLSNAIKYAQVNSTIAVVLENDRLSFYNIGNPIKDTKHIFDKYFRENSVVGGHGLGLSIVSDIAKKYSITITLHSDAQNGTTFLYTFKCHTNDMSLV
ncbi:MAG TPA: HAMP domain-containing sensor histidine kinase [Sulfuricurvum sp.]|nr:HAMP domain-containing sensor histidine kinase [Sulfuricurvum sp.]